MCHLRRERPLTGLPGFRSLPYAATPGNRLYQVGRSRTSGDALPEVNRQLLKATLQGRDHVTLDIDTPVVHAQKTARRTCRVPKSRLLD